MVTLKRTSSDHPDFKYLIQLFDDYLVEINSDEKDFYTQFCQIYVKNEVNCYENHIPLACGAFKKLEPNAAEIKRIFVLPESRGTEIASKVLTEIESRAIEEKHVVFILKN